MNEGHKRAFLIILIFLGNMGEKGVVILWQAYIEDLCLAEGLSLWADNFLWLIPTMDNSWRRRRTI